VESDAKNLMKETQTLEARTQALQQQLDSQRQDFAQRLFEAQQDVEKVGFPTP
jgi:predicted  nucleic acid-binding Zn-ribbon protein